MDPPAHSDNLSNTMEPVYMRMNDPNLLKRLAKGKTQITNESYHGVVRSRCEWIQSRVLISKMYLR